MIEMVLITKIAVCIISCLLGIVASAVAVRIICYAIDGWDWNVMDIAGSIGLIALGLLAFSLGIGCFIFGVAFLFNFIC